MKKITFALIAGFAMSFTGCGGGVEDGTINQTITPAEVQAAHASEEAEAEADGDDD